MKRNQISGLCGYCLNSPDCVFLKKAVRPVLECEEFYPTVKTDPEKESRPALASEFAEAQVREYDGLCRLCDKKDSCIYVKDRAVIWHCEEYE
ncbi:MAG: hypothetical protein PHV82_08040 [Victivallaceae bacterium]|nr:hypothetical protein [Victivallaceae bacterium]